MTENSFKKKEARRKKLDRPSHKLHICISHCPSIQSIHPSSQSSTTAATSERSSASAVAKCTDYQSRRQGPIHCAAFDLLNSLVSRSTVFICLITYIYSIGLQLQSLTSALFHIGRAERCLKGPFRYHLSSWLPPAPFVCCVPFSFCFVVLTFTTLTKRAKTKTKPKTKISFCFCFCSVSVSMLAIVIVGVLFQNFKESAKFLAYSFQ